MRVIIDKLTEYYRRKHQDGEVTVYEAEKLALGWETELYSIVVELERSGHRVKEEHIVRLFSGAYGAEKAEKEYKVMNYLFNAGYPVPKVFHLETDESTLSKPFIVMERIEGHNMMDDLMNASEEGQKSLMTLFIRLWVNLHNLKVPNEFKGTGTQEYVDRILSWSRKHIVENRIDWLKPVLDWLDERKTQVSSETPSIIHRDYHPNNVMLRNDGSPVVLDWGATEAGDYRDDLAWTILLGTVYLDQGFKETVLKTYREISGHKVQDIEFFEVIAIFRRLHDFAISFTSGPEKMGMRPGALAMMRQDSAQYTKVYDLLKKRTGLRIP
ncbi:phosphotransferase, partial [Candidatus Bathyarchaeota archaeon]|nr:phosphotransferase [Candidatus Bathyarchaeota archaeon]